jgi:anaerobic ribonucleoside-triphosphate reductase activating protein
MFMGSVIDIRYAQIRDLDLSNGEGIGVAIFVQGCKFHCKNCFNPDTWDFSGGKEWTCEIKEKFFGILDKPYIKRVTILGGEPLADENLEEILELVIEINNRHNIPQHHENVMEKSCNIPFQNIDQKYQSSIRKMIWLYTGYTICMKKRCGEKVLSVRNCDGALDTVLSTKLREKILEHCHVVIDGRYVDEQRDITLLFRGSRNQRLINVNESLRKGQIILWQENDI